MTDLTLQRKMFAMHFATEDYTRVTCGDCIDFKIRQCLGSGYAGRQCFECIGRHTLTSHKVVVDRQPGGYPFLREGNRVIAEVDLGDP